MAVEESSDSSGPLRFCGAIGSAGGHGKADGDRDRDRNRGGRERGRVAGNTYFGAIESAAAPEIL